MGHILLLRILDFPLKPVKGCTMKLLLAAVIIPVLFAQKCPDVAPTKCGAEDMQCWGGMDSNNCAMPDTCAPMVGPKGKDGSDCYGNCPTTCGPKDMQCPAKADDYGCPMKDTCAPMKDGCPAV